jgi:hypothetical protein
MSESSAETQPPVPLSNKEEVTDHFSVGRSDLYLTSQRLIKTRVTGQDRSEERTTSVYHHAVTNVSTYSLDGEPADSTEQLIGILLMIMGGSTTIGGIVNEALPVTLVGLVVGVLGLVVLAIAVDTDAGHTTLRINTVDDIEWKFRFGEGNEKPKQISMAITAHQTE